MPRLPISLSDTTRDIEPPKTWQEFEELCTDVFPLIQDKFSIPRSPNVKNWFSSGYGKSGNKQWGVDIFDYFSTSTMQCKRVEKFTLKNLKSELTELEKYPHPISVHFIAISLEKLNRDIIDHIRSHNDAIAPNGNYKLPQPELPKIRLPMILILNWQDIKKSLAEDFFLASKWNLQPYGGRYTHLNGININELEQAVNTRGCFIPPNYGGKPPQIVEAIRRITEDLSTYEIENLGITNMVLTKTVNDMFSFIQNFDNANAMADQFTRTLGACSSLDNLSRHKALSELNKIAVYHQRIDALKYLSRLYESVKCLAEILDNANYYYHVDEEIECSDGTTYFYENLQERWFHFIEDQDNDHYSSISRIALLQKARFISSELNKVRDQTL